MIRYGLHMNIGKGFAFIPGRAKELGCSAIQIFSGNPRGWQVKELDDNDITLYKKKIKEYDIRPVVIHMPYLPNFASPDDILFKKSVNSLINELVRANSLNAEYVNAHIGKAKESSFEQASDKVALAINTAFKQDTSNVMLLLENTAGQGTELGADFKSIKMIIDKIENKKRIGVCLDTAHLFEAGYDLRSADKIDQTFKEFDRIVGMDHLKTVHFNDSLTEFNSKVDRHWHIGQGEIGEKGMKALLFYKPLKNIPFIMETPKKTEEDEVMNMNTVRKYLKENWGRWGC